MIGANSLYLRAKQIHHSSPIVEQISCGHIILSSIKFGLSSKPSKEMSVIKGGTSSKGKIIGIDCFKGEKKKKKKVGGGEEEIWDAEEVEETGHYPEHLVVLVNGIVGSAEDWKFAAQQFVKKLPDKVIVHRSECNSSTLTFDGVDLMGERLAEEGLERNLIIFYSAWFDKVLSVVKRRHGVQKISFVGHSLGGSIARHAIGRLYEPSPQSESSALTGNLSEVHSSISGNSQERLSEGKIAGLEPLNFITFAQLLIWVQGEINSSLYSVVSHSWREGHLKLHT